MYATKCSRVSRARTTELLVRRGCRKQREEPDMRSSEPSPNKARLVSTLLVVVLGVSNRGVRKTVRTRQIETTFPLSTCAIVDGTFQINSDKLLNSTQRLTYTGTFPVLKYYQIYLTTPGITF